MDLFNPVKEQNDYGARDKMGKVSIPCVGQSTDYR
jgi:hypothetical protein